MTSEIQYQTIDGTYPVAGVDNDTQGFRDNFTIIKTSLGTAQAEITALQERALLKDALPGDTLENNLNGNNIVDANLQISTEQFINIGTVVTGQNISFLNGSYQNVIINLPTDTDDIYFTLSDWPETGRLAKMTVQLYAAPSDDDPKNVYFLVENGGTLKKRSTMAHPVVVDPGSNGLSSSVEDTDTGSPIIVEFWTYNGGNTVYANSLGTFVNA